MGKVSVVIPSYNHEKYIKQAVDSVLGQTYENLELIIIDDGSKDGSWEYISGITDKRVVSRRQENQGAHNAINEGLSMAGGEYLAILNSDDEYMPERLERMLGRFCADASLDFLCSHIQIIDGDGKDLGVKEGWGNCEPWPIAHPEKSYKAMPDFNKNIIMTNFAATTSNFVFRRDVYESIGGMRNLRFAHDWDFALRAAAGGYKCDILREPLVRYRVHGSNTISSNREWLLFETCLVVAANIGGFYGRDIFASPDGEDLGEQISLLGHSMEFQGNDKVFWMIREYLEAARRLGMENPEEALMDDADLRQRFIEHIKDGDNAPASGVNGSMVSDSSRFRRKFEAIIKIFRG